VQIALHRDDLLRRYGCDYTVVRLLNAGHHKSGGPLKLLIVVRSN
jgi:hypothetical protein